MNQHYKSITTFIQDGGNFKEVKNGQELMNSSVVLSNQEIFFKKMHKLFKVGSFIFFLGPAKWKLTTALPQIVWKQTCDIPLPILKMRVGRFFACVQIWKMGDPSRIDSTKAW